MNSGTKIVVFRVREIVYTLLLLFLAVILIVCLVIMFGGKKTDSGTDTALEEPAENASVTAVSGEAESRAVYTAGVYLASVNLGDSTAEVEVTVDQNRIRAIRLINLTKEMEEAYPLVSSSLETISEQILEKQNLDGITAPAESRYTSQLLLNAVSKALETALNLYA